jgi:hypothetical protein
MPYRHAHYWLLSLFPLTLLAFWPNYFSRLSDAPPGLHFHGITASLWIALLATQSWTIQRRRNSLHKALGYSSFLLFPLFLTGGLLVLQSMSQTTAAGLSPFYDLFGARLATFDFISSLGIGYFFFMALKHRRNVQLHARYMIGTIFFLLGPIIARALPVGITGPETFGRFPLAFHLANLITLVFILALYRSSGRCGRPLIIAGGLVVLQSLAFETLGITAAWRSFFFVFGATPSPVLVSLGLTAAAAIIWLGWIAGHRAKPGMATI